MDTTSDIEAVMTALPKQPSPASSSHLPLPSPLFTCWLLRPDIVHLDHGSSGGVPRPIFSAQTSLRLCIESSSPNFFLRHYHSLLRASKTALAAFLHADPRYLALMPGTTHAMNAVLQSQHFQPGEEILTTSHAYASTISLLQSIAARDGAVMKTAQIPLAPRSQDEILQLILASVTPQTRFAVIDHIPSRTALIYPIAAIIRALAAVDIDVCVDGAHAPGQIPLDLDELHAAYYVASCHKWMCAPRGVGFLYVRPDKVAGLKPVVVARTTYSRDEYEGEHSVLEHLFDWFGTFDASAYGVLPQVITWLETLIPDGNEARMRKNHDLAVKAREVVFRAVGIGKGARWIEEAMIPCMVTVPLPDSRGKLETGVLAIQKRLWERYRVEVQVYSFPRWPGRTLRFCCQGHNDLGQYFYLGDCLRTLLAEEKLL